MKKGFGIAGVLAVVAATTLGLGPAAGSWALAAAPGLEAAAPGLESEPSGQIGVRLEPDPNGPPADIRDRFYIVTHLNPGQALTRTITAINDTAEPQHLDLYPAAATIEGASWSVAPDRTPNDLTGWTTVTPSTVDLEAGATAPVEVTIQVPANAPRGERYAVAWVSAHSKPGPGQIFEIHRVGIRMYVDVAPGGDPPSNFTLDTPAAVRDAAGHPVISVNVTNTGQRALDVSGTVALSHGPGGLSAAPIRVQQVLTLAPGARGQVSAVLDANLPGGDWSADFALASGSVERAASFPITLSPSRLAPVSESSSNSSSVFLIHCPAFTCM